MSQSQIIILLLIFVATFSLAICQPTNSAWCVCFSPQTT